LYSILNGAAVRNSGSLLKLFILINRFFNTLNLVIDTGIVEIKLLSNDKNSKDGKLIKTSGKFLK